MGSDQQTQFFYQLTPERILDAVEEFGFRCTGRCLALNSMENRVYEVELELDTDPESPSEAFRVIKFYRPGRWSREQILEEHQFLAELKEADLGVIAPLPLEDGKTLGEISDLGISFTVFPKFGGRVLDEWSNEQLLQMGRTIARMHIVGKQHPAKHRIQLNIDTYGKANLEYLLSENFLSPTFQDRYSQLVTDICNTAEAWFEDAPLQRIHGDCHIGNILWRDQHCMLVDFDDMLMGPTVQDLWLITPGRDEENLRQRELLLEGYEQMLTFPRETLRLIEPLRALRIIHFSAWIARRWEDPAFPRCFPDFGTDQYWSEQIAALQEILMIMHGAE